MATWTRTGVGGAFHFARLGVDKLHWFFYGNSTNCDTLYCRSGLTGSSTTSFALKRSFRAFEGMLSILGGAHFRSVLWEDAVAWIYGFSDAQGFRRISRRGGRWTLRTHCR